MPQRTDQLNACSSCECREEVAGIAKCIKLWRIGSKEVWLLKRFRVWSLHCCCTGSPLTPVVNLLYIISFLSFFIVCVYIFLCTYYDMILLGADWRISKRSRKRTKCLGPPYWEIPRFISTTVYVKIALVYQLILCSFSSLLFSFTF